ncbi:hypothetical protein [Actinokineospora iranica]|uniref:Uncharacterized protein n=1 Tax=Actinokineospora iranica TaxID=1271860 RepID=A0A1G6Q2M1_9PSEU|nr:hypothetical protein [Actinokineospora iranica]SDC85877.1 hypothetical protein SAMN05216174_10524 [Actinokineospora iranica]
MRAGHSWNWRLSGYDDRVHAFPAGERPASFVEAVCAHTVPFGRVARTHTGARCLSCLLIVGDRLAERAGGPLGTSAVD